MLKFNTLAKVFAQLIYGDREFVIFNFSGQTRNRLNWLATKVGLKQTGENDFNVKMSREQLERLAKKQGLGELGPEAGDEFFSTVLLNALQVYEACVDAECGGKQAVIRLRDDRREGKEETPVTIAPVNDGRNIYETLMDDVLEKYEMLLDEYRKGNSPGILSTPGDPASEFNNIFG